ncbi:SIS domain-containing protein [Mesoaciditoga sp.]
MLTLNEIDEQPEKLKAVAQNYSKLSSNAVKLLRSEKFSQVNFVGCGTSYNLAMGLSYQLKRFSKTPSNFFSGSEIAFGLTKLRNDSLLIGLSRSGESTETVLAMKKAKDEGIKTIGVTCEANSSITRTSDISIVLSFINERSVVMTQSFTSMAFFVSAMIRNLFAPESLDDYLNIIPELSKNVLNDSQSFFDNVNFAKFDHFVFLGYDEYFATSLEGVTKVTETSLSEVEAYQGLEYRHGPKSKVTDHTFICILSNEVLKEEEEKLANEMKTLGARVLNISKSKMKDVDNIIVDYNKNDFGDWFLRVIPAQIIGVKKAAERGLNPDNPKNLTKVVKL